MTHGNILASFGNRVVSALWSSVNGLARRLAVRRAKLPVRVISVGNIQAGGAGKTPVVGWLARQAHDRGLTACILTRGYRGVWENSLEGGVLPPGVSAPISGCGDEAALLRDLAPHAWIGVGSDRAAQFGRVVSRGARPDLVILDDGFQNFKLHKDLEIVALTSARPGERVFRDFPGALKHADVLLWTKGTDLPLRGNFQPVPMVRLHFRSQSKKPIDPKKDFLFVSGLADGGEAARLASQGGLKIKRHARFEDHAAYTREDAEMILSQAKAESLAVLLTGKDWVKWRELGVPEDAVCVLEPEIELSDADRNLLEQVLWDT